MNAKRILLIEDNVDTSLLIRRSLLQLGYSNNNIIACFTLSEVITHVKDKFSVVITDLSLPDSPASETFEKVQARFPFVPIIVISSYADQETAIRSIQLGAQDYLLKTDLSSALLEKAIQYAIERNRIRNEYLHLFDGSPIAMYIYDSDTFQFLAVNEACVRQYGYSREEFLQMTAKDIRPADELEAFYGIVPKIPETFYDFGKWKHRRKNGNEFYVNIYAHATAFNGRQARLASAVDIDKAAAAEKKLQEKNEEVSNILESITDGFITLNKDWDFTYINKQCEKMMGLSREKIIGKNIWSVFPEGINLRFFDEYHKAATEQINVHFEEYSPLLGIWVSVSVYPSENGLSIYFVDISERKKFDDLLFNETQQLKAIINNTTDVIFSVDKNFLLTIANEAFWKQVSKITGNSDRIFSYDLFNKNIIAIWQKHVAKALSGNAFTIVWHDTMQEKNAYREISFNPIRNKSDDIIGVSCFSRDITRQHLHLQKIQSQNEQLQKITWLQSHELRLPVANILGLCHLLNVDDPGDPDNPMVMKGIVESAERLDATIRKIANDADDAMTDPGYN